MEIQRLEAERFILHAWMVEDAEDMFDYAKTA